MGALHQDERLLHDASTHREREKVSQLWLEGCRKDNEEEKTQGKKRADDRVCEEERISSPIRHPSPMSFASALPESIISRIGRSFVYCPIY